MNINIQAVKFTMDEDQKKYLDQKFKRIEYADNLITDIQCFIKLDKKFIYDTTINFRWGGARPMFQPKTMSLRPASIK